MTSPAVKGLHLSTKGLLNRLAFRNAWGGNQIVGKRLRNNRRQDCKLYVEWLESRALLNGSNPFKVTLLPNPPDLGQVQAKISPAPINVQNSSGDSLRLAKGGEPTPIKIELPDNDANQTHPMVDGALKAVDARLFADNVAPFGQASNAGDFATLKSLPIGSTVDRPPIGANGITPNPASEVVEPLGDAAISSGQGSISRANPVFLVHATSPFPAFVAIANRTNVGPVIPPISGIRVIEKITDSPMGVLRLDKETEVKELSPRIPNSRGDVQPLELNAPVVETEQAEVPPLPLQPPRDEQPVLLPSPGLMADVVSFDLKSLSQGVQRFLDQVENFGTTLMKSPQEMGLSAWLAAATAAGLAVQIGRQQISRNSALRLGLASRRLGETATWFLTETPSA